MKRLFTILFLGISLMATAQSTNVFTLFHNSQKKADFYYDQKAWRNALELYLRITDRDPSNLHALLRIADCYINLNEPSAAEVSFLPLVTAKKIPPNLQYNYAEILCKNGWYLEAKKWYEQYALAFPKDPLPKGKIDFINHIDHFRRDSLLATVTPVSFNSKHADFGAQYFNHGLVFVSSRDQDMFIKRRSVAAETEDEAFLNLFYCKEDTLGNFGADDLFLHGKFRNVYNDGPIAFFDGNRKAVFTRNNIVKGKPVRDSDGRMNLVLFFADVDSAGRLTNIIPFSYNNSNYSVAHASLTADGNTMYFSSNMPHGTGGADIYFCQREGRMWGEPVNAGPSINTAGDEFYPFVANDSTLFFASNGQGGFGGFDIFVANKRTGVFKTALNLGTPINSSRDDFSMVTDSTGKVGYFASNRLGGKGSDDIYTFKADHYKTLGQTREYPNLATIIPNVLILVRDENGVVVDSTRSDAEGYFHLDLPLEENFSILAKKEGYDLLADIGYSTKGRQIGIDSVLFPLWKQELFVKGNIYSKETQAVLPGAVVTFENLTDHNVDSVVVGENGDYASLVYPGKKYRIQVHKPGFIPEGYNLNTEGIYKGDLLNDIVVEEVYVVKGTVNFDFNKFDMSPESVQQMDKLIRTLQRFPATTLSIRAHADSRGTAQYNQIVSDKRAVTISKYFTMRGIAKKRIDAKGFGEELVLNRCSDGVECSEEEHSKNRRAELKVQQE